MTYIIRLARVTAFGWALVAALAPSTAGAQASPEATEIAACLCLQQAVSTLSAEMNSKNQALDAVTRQLADLDAQLARARSARRRLSPIDRPGSCGRNAVHGAIQCAGQRIQCALRKSPVQFGRRDSN